MAEFLRDILVSSPIAACSMFVSLLALFYARKNIKMQKYIDVVTAQRLKWITELRCDFSEILSFLYSSTYVKKLADTFDETKDKSVATPEKIADYISKIELCILKLNRNDSEDQQLIEKLEIIKTFPFGDYQIGKLDADLKTIRDLMSDTLKKEWERAKLEVQKGGLVSGKRNNIFD